MLKTPSQCDGNWRWGLWEVTGIGWHDGVDPSWWNWCPYDKRRRNQDSLPASCKDTARRWLSISQEESSSRTQPGEFPGGPVLRAPQFYCWVWPTGRGTRIPQASGPKKRKMPIKKPSRLTSRSWTSIQGLLNSRIVRNNLCCLSHSVYSIFYISPSWLSSKLQKILNIK